MLKGVKPFLSVETDLGLIYPYITTETEMYIPIPSIKYAVSLGYKIRIVQSLLFKGATVLERYFNDLFKMKREATAKG